MTMNVNEIADAMGGSVVDDNPFEDFKNLKPGRYKMKLVGIEVKEFEDKKKPGEFYKTLNYRFDELEGKGSVWQMYGASFGPKAKNRPFVESLSEQGIPAWALENRATFWQYTKSLIGNVYTVIVKQRPDSDYLDIASIMYEGPGDNASQQVAASTNTAPQKPNFDEDLPY